jgi:hypothetical protein
MYIGEFFPSCFIASNDFFFSDFKDFACWCGICESRDLSNDCFSCLDTCIKVPLSDLHNQVCPCTEAYPFDSRLLLYEVC